FPTSRSWRLRTSLAISFAQRRGRSVEPAVRAVAAPALPTHSRPGVPSPVALHLPHRSLPAWWLCSTNPSLLPALATSTRRFTRSRKRPRTAPSTQLRLPQLAPSPTGHSAPPTRPALLN